MTTVSEKERSQFEQMHAQLSRKESARWSIDTHLSFLSIILVAFFALRMSVIHDTTLFYDEAVNLTVGTEILAGDFAKHSTNWIFGSNIFPVTIALVEKLGGAFGREVTLILLSMVSLCAVYLLTRDLFGKTAALWALVLFGLTAASLNLSHLAVYDALALPLVALALFAVVNSSNHTGRPQYIWLASASVLLGISVLVKYVVLLFLPAFAVVGIAVYMQRGRPLLRPFMFAVFIATAIIGLYTIANFNALINVLQNQSSILNISATRREILYTLAHEGSVITVLAVMGGGWVLYRIQKQLSGVKASLLLVFIPLAVLIIFLAPIYHLVSQNIQSLWKHMLYTQLFLAPLAGYFLMKLNTEFISRPQASSVKTKLAATVLLTLLINLFANYSLGRNWGFQRSWPNASAVLDYLDEYPLTIDTRILAEQSSVYEYYFDFGANDFGVWNSTFAFDYANLTDVEAMTKAIEDQYFDLIILDDYYTADKNAQIRQALDATGYTLAYATPPQLLSTGQTITIAIYILPKERIQ